MPNPDQVTSGRQTSPVTLVAVPLWPAMALMASAGAAYLWWSHWGRILASPMPTAGAQLAGVASTISKPSASSAPPAESSATFPGSLSGAVDTPQAVPALSSVAQATEVSSSPSSVALDAGLVADSNRSQSVPALAKLPGIFSVLAEPQVNSIVELHPPSASTLDLTSSITDVEGSANLAEVVTPSIQTPSADTYPSMRRFGGDVSAEALTNGPTYRKLDQVPFLEAEAALPESAVQAIEETLGVQGTEPVAPIGADPLDPSPKPRGRRKPST